MSIFGNETVFVLKDSETKVWVVSTSKLPRQHLITIPWSAVFQTFTDAQAKQYTDYIEAITTCQSHPNTALTAAEERGVLRDLEAAKAPPVAVVHDTAVPTSLPIASRSNVVSVDFKKRRRT